MTQAHLPVEDVARESRQLSSDNDAQIGFSLLECIIAIAIIGSALIISSALLNSLVGAAELLRAHTEMLRELETAVEMMRSGFIPLESGTLTLSGSNEQFPDLRVTAIVEKQDAPGLHVVTLRAECSLRRRTASRMLVTEIWRE